MMSIRSGIEWEVGIGESQAASTCGDAWLERCMGEGVFMNFGCRLHLAIYDEM